jgi:hypothetical protein
MEMYHCCITPLEVGSVILPGNWGRIIKLYTSAEGNVHIAYREKILEDHRQANFPNKPSRLDGVFGCRDLMDAIQYKLENARWSIIYRVETVTQDHRVHHAPWTFDYNDARKFYFEGTHAVANTYWQEHPLTQDMETLVDCPVRVVERIHVSAA